MTSGYQRCAISVTKDGQYELRVKPRGMAFDLGGIAKGFAADEMLRGLKKAGFSRVAIIAGGDVRVGDAPRGKEGWEVGLRTIEREKIDETIVLSNAAVSTSGGLYQTVIIEGVSYSHIVDPATGLGLTNAIAASVVARDATHSDAIATAACVAGPERALENIGDWGGIAVRVVSKDSGVPKVAVSKGFAELVKREAPDDGEGD